MSEITVDQYVSLFKHTNIDPDDVSVVIVNTPTIVERSDPPLMILRSEGEAEHFNDVLPYIRRKLDE